MGWNVRGIDHVFFFSPRVLMASLQMKWALVKQYRALPSWPIWLRWVRYSLSVFLSLDPRSFSTENQPLWSTVLSSVACQDSMSCSLPSGLYKLTKYGETVRFSRRLGQFLSMCGLEAYPTTLAPS